MKKPLKLLVTSDLHLSPFIWRHRPIKGDSYFSWKYICDIAVDEEVDAVVLAGDLLDKQSNPSEVIVHLLDGLQRLKDVGIKVFYVQGQHEYQQLPWASLAGNVWLNDKIVDFKGWKIAGSDFKQAAEFQEFLASDTAKSADILVCHQVWHDFMGDVAVNQGSFSDVPSTVKLLITGDFHEHIHTRSGDTIVLSPGSTHMRSIAEPEEKCCFVVTADEPNLRKLQVQTFVIPTRRVVRIDLTDFLLEEAAASDEDYDRVYAAITDKLEDARIHAENDDLPEDLRKPLLHVRHFKEDTAIVNKLVKAFTEKAHMFFKQLVAKQVDEVIQVEAQPMCGLLAYLPAFLDVEDESFPLAASLIDAEDPVACLTKWLESKSDADK
jgi:DNA repair exonuclease SbcCD nuclease subunit